VIDKDVGEAVLVEPRFERGRISVVLARMAYEKDRHLPVSPLLEPVA
jgi:hypothetical protein